MYWFELNWTTSSCNLELPGTTSTIAHTCPTLSVKEFYTPGLKFWFRNFSHLIYLSFLDMEQDLLIDQVLARTDTEPTK